MLPQIQYRETLHSPKNNNQTTHNCRYTIDNHSGDAAMHFLPKVNPLYEHVSAQKIIIPDVLEKLGKGGFTGYLSYSSTTFESYCIFAKGKLICVISTEDGRDKTGFDAISSLFNKIVITGGEVNVYRMTTDLAMCAHALLLGTKLFNGNEVRHVDIKDTMTHLKNQWLNGVVHFYTNERYAMIFYMNGQPIGFYHDGAKAIETSSEESRKIAALPGARLDVCATKPLEDLMHYDLLQMVNLGKLWEAASTRNTTSQIKELKTFITEDVGQCDKKLSELVDDLMEVAMAYLSKEGREVIKNRLQEAGGSSILFDSTKTGIFLGLVEEDAKAIDDTARIFEMIDLMKSEIVGRLAV